MKKIIIMHLAEAPGGVERYLITLIKKMRCYEGVEHILVCSDAYHTENFKDLVKEVICVSDIHNAIAFKDDLVSVRQVRKIIKQYKPNIVYCHSSKAGAIGRIADMGIRNKCIYNAHGWSFNMKGISRRKLKLYEIIERMLANITDKIVCISEFEKKSALEHGICKAEKLIVINNGIDLNIYEGLYSKSKAELGIPENTFVVGTVGRLTKQKAPDVFVQMALDIKKKIDNAFFVMVGDGAERQKVEGCIEKAGLQNSFLITGWVDNPLVYVNCFNVATLLSRWEGFGLVLPEYMIMETPIVASRVDAIPYVIGDAGVLIEVDDYKAAADSVIRISEDIELRSRLVENERKRVHLFNAERTAYEHANLFKDLFWCK